MTEKLKKNKTSNHSQKPLKSDSYVGFFEHCSSHGLIGWAATKENDQKLNVNILIDGVPYCTVVADSFRMDLVEAGINDGHHAFSILPPNELFDSKNHKIDIIVKESGQPLEGSPKFFKGTAAEAFEIKIEYGSLVGYARLFETPTEGLRLEVVEGDCVLTTGYGSLNEHSPDNVNFNFQLPSSVFDGKPHLFSVRCAESNIFLASLLTTTRTSLTPESALLEYSRKGLRPQIMHAAGFRYESLVKSLESMSDNSNAIDTPEMRNFAEQIIRVHKRIASGWDENDTTFMPLNFPRHESPVFSIVIPFHNKFPVTYHCLLSLLLAHNEATYEAILVDDGSTDVGEEAPKLIKGIKHKRNSKAKGFIHACNAGAKLASGRYIVMLNNDTEVTTGWLDELLWPFNNFDQVGMVGAKLIYPDGTLQEAGGIVWDNGDPWNYGRKGNPYDTRFNYTRQTDYLSGACIAVPKDLWETVGGFDEMYVPAYFEDTDLAFKIRAQGFKTVYTPMAQVIHYEGVSNGLSVESGNKKFQEINRPKFKKLWISCCRNHGKVGQDIELNKDRNVELRALIIDVETPRPDQNAGGYAAIQEIRMLQALGFKCTFVPTNLAWLSSYTEDLQRSGVEALYSPYINSISNLLEQRGNEFDLIYITRYYVAQQFIEDIRKYAPKSKIVLNNADLHFLRELRTAVEKRDPKAIESSLLTRDSELSTMRNVDLVLSYTDVEKAVIFSHNLDSSKVEKCPWVVDVIDNPADFSNRKHIAFLGGYNHSPNVEAVEWFSANILPLLEKEAPEIELHVYGSHVPSEFKTLAEEHKNLIIKGWVPSVSAVYENCRIFIAPLISGAGIKGKVIDALAHGVPCVLSPLAAEGIPMRRGADAYICDTHSEWVKAITSLYYDEKMWKNLSTNSLEFARHHYGFDKGVAQMKSILENVDIFTNVDNKNLYFKQ